MSVYSLEVSLSQFLASPLFHVCSSCCFLACMQVSQEAGKVVWYSLHFIIFLLFIVFHTVKGFSQWNRSRCFFWNSLAFCDPTDVGNLISGSSAFSKSSLYIWKFSVHVLLKPSLKDFEHNLANTWNEHSCAVVHLTRLSYLSLLFLETLHSVGYIFPFLFAFHLSIHMLPIKWNKYWVSIELL